jgi:hypothetical protein
VNVATVPLVIAADRDIGDHFRVRGHQDHAHAGGGEGRRIHRPGRFSGRSALAPAVRPVPEWQLRIGDHGPVSTFWREVRSVSTMVASIMDPCVDAASHGASRCEAVAVPLDSCAPAVRLSVGNRSGHQT